MKVSENVLDVWNQTTIPVIVRRTKKGQQHRLRLPYDKENRYWIKNNRRSNPIWVSQSKFWEIPKAWFNDFIERALTKYGRIWIIQPYREQEICATACMNAVGHECQCSCMGANHGSGNDGSWFEVSEAFATRWKGQQWACRLLAIK